MSPGTQTPESPSPGFQDVFVLDTHVDDDFREAYVLDDEPRPVDDGLTPGEEAAEAEMQRERERDRQRVHLIQEEAARKLATAAEEAYARGWEEGQRAMAPELEAEIRAKMADEADAELERSRREAQENLQAECDRASAALLEAARTVRAAQERMKESYAADVVRLALGVAKEVIMRELTTDPAMVEASVRHCLQRSHGQQVFQVRVNPSDRDLVGRAFEGGEGAQPDIVADDNIEPGGCIVDTDLGSVDGQIETRWDRVVSVFEESFRG